MSKRDLWTRTMASILGLFAPGAAMSYIRSRSQYRRYAGASVTGHNRHRPTRRSADAIIARDNAMLVARARDLVRNNAVVAGAIRKIVDNVIHTGIQPQAQARTADGSPDAVNDTIEQVWRTWSKANKFLDIQRLCLRHWWIDGEVLVHLWIDKARLDQGMCPLRLTVLEQDMLDATVDGQLPSGNIAKRGIEFDKKNDPVAYHILTTHPGDAGITSIGTDTKRIPARDILHIFVPERASQTRGVSMMAPVIQEMTDLSEYQVNERIAARLASAFGIFVKSNMDLAGVALGGLPGDDPTAEPELSDYIEPGRIQMLPYGTEVQTAKSDRPGTTYEPYVKTSLKEASVGFGLRYGNFSHDYADSSYSSERSASLDERRGWIGQQRVIIDQLCEPVMRRWLEVAVGSGLLPASVVSAPVTWQTPGWPWIDPTKDAKASQVELALGVTTRRKIAAARGDDWDEIVEQLAREQLILREHGLEDNNAETE
jgi:lambda family phage portal protein